MHYDCLKKKKGKEIHKRRRQTTLLLYTGKRNPRAATPERIAKTQKMCENRYIETVSREKQLCNGPQFYQWGVEFLGEINYNIIRNRDPGF